MGKKFLIKERIGRIFCIRLAILIFNLGKTKSIKHDNNINVIRKYLNFPLFCLFSLFLILFLIKKFITQIIEPITKPIIKYLIITSQFHKLNQI